MQKLRLFLLPFSWIYGLITFIRNMLFDIGLKESFEIPKRSICVGNLSVGGTGKTPHIIYLIELLKSTQKVTTLSRGYGRKTSGFLLANSNSSASDLGDEPFLFKNRFQNEIQVSVCEKRKEGIEKLMNENFKSDVFLLDDAFQHRHVKAGLNIVLSDFCQPFFKDFMLPAGNLREWSIGINRADVLVFTKCPDNLNEKTKEYFKNKVNFNSENIFFSKIKYGELIPFGSVDKTKAKTILIVTGIANPSPLVQHFKRNYHVELLKFPDHYDFTLKDIEDIHQKFDNFEVRDKIIVTTEKDYVRLLQPNLIEKIKIYPWFYQSIDIEIDREEEFNKLIIDYVDTI